MIRLSVFAILIMAIWLYAFRDWYISLCGLIVLTVLTQMDDMPTTMMGIQGLNPWNLTLVVVTLAWLIQRTKENRPWKLGALPTLVIIAYAGNLLIAFLREITDLGSFPPGHPKGTFSGVLADDFINPFKYMWAAFLLGDGANTRQRAKTAILAIIILGVAYGVMVVKVVPLGTLIDSGRMMLVRKKIDNEVGLHANDMSKVLLVTFWSIVAAHHLWKGTLQKFGFVIMSGFALVGIAACYSRAGYATFLGVGLIMACVRWRKLLLIGPFALVIFCLVFPSIVERSLMGFESNYAGGGSPDLNEITAGRTGNLWPPTIEEIGNAPFLGQGRLSILRTDAYGKIMALEGNCPSTPHNGYLEVLIDTGFLGLAITSAFFLGIAGLSFALMRDADPLMQTVGGMGVVASLSLLINAMSGGILFPDQGMLGMLCSFFLSCRLWAGRGRLYGVAKQSLVRRPVPVQVRPRYHMRTQ